MADHTNSNHRVVTNSSLEGEVTAPAPLVVPEGTLFFGYKYVPYVPPDAGPNDTPSSPPVRDFLFFGGYDDTDLPYLFKPISFSGRGNTLAGSTASQQPPASSKGKGKERAPSNWGSGGQALGSKAPPPPAERPRGAGGASVPIIPQRNRKPQERSPSPEIDFGVSDDEDYMVDSD